jgi:hypothetical protein
MLGRKLVTEQTGPLGRLIKRVYVEQAVQAVHELMVALLVETSSGELTLLGSTSRGGHGISRLPDTGEKSARARPFCRDRDRLSQIGVCELRLAVGRLHMFRAIDRVSKFTYVEFHRTPTPPRGLASSATSWLPSATRSGSC